MTNQTANQALTEAFETSLEQYLEQAKDLPLAVVTYNGSPIGVCLTNVSPSAGLLKEH